jgi:hypothetical protein
VLRFCAIVPRLICPGQGEIEGKAYSYPAVFTIQAAALPWLDPILAGLVDRASRVAFMLNLMVSSLMEVNLCCAIRASLTRNKTGRTRLTRAESQLVMACQIIAPKYKRGIEGDHYSYYAWRLDRSYEGCMLMTQKRDV